MPRSGPRAGVRLADQAAEPCSRWRVLAGRTAAARSPRVRTPDRRRKETSTRLPARAARHTESALHPLFGGKGGGRGRRGGMSERVVTYDLTVDGV